MRVEFFLRSVGVPVLGALLAVAPAPAPAQAQNNLAGLVIARVCLPYASRARSFEATIRAARDMEFRRPVGDRAPLEDWASEVELVSRDGRWRLRIEEGTIEEDGVEVYAATCGISSRGAGARHLGRMARLVVGRNPSWLPSPGVPGRWEKRRRDGDEHALRLEVTQGDGQQPTLAARGVYY